MLDKGIKQPSENPRLSPVILIHDTFGSLQGSKFLSSMDLSSGYWQIEIHVADRENTACIPPEALYEYNVMPFGLCNAPTIFWWTR
ncbi:retrovirus-related Pol polyprotein from transposon 297 [Trichonephila clavipes]|nr:retrovirus-related Pol polyprotein from transposon 297 [Trichonephila clavipes]